jgi:hypothetical protein
MSIGITSDRPKIIKLHGDYLFERLKNTVEELEQLDPNMERKFREFAKDCGVVVLGYGGRDRSIMRVVEELLGVYWGVRRERDGTFRTASRVEELATRFAKHFTASSARTSTVHGASALDAEARAAADHSAALRHLARDIRGFGRTPDRWSVRRADDQRAHGGAERGTAASPGQGDGRRRPRLAAIPAGARPT